MNDTPTPRKNETAVRLYDEAQVFVGSRPSGLLIQGGDEIFRLERELTAVTEQRDRLRSGIDYACDQLSKITKQRDEYLKDYMCLAELLDGHDATECRMNLVRLKGQRDSLAEALDENVAEERYRNRLLQKQHLNPQPIQPYTTQPEPK